MSIEDIEMLNKVNSGATCTVYRAKDKNDKEGVLKIIDRKKINNFDECKMTEMVSDIDGIPELYMYDNSGDDFIYIFMEEIKGRELFDILIDKDFYYDCKPHFKSIFDKLCKILIEVHKRGILHGDIKLENIIITSDFKPYLIDWGLSSEFSETRSYCGTLTYLPPEVFTYKTLSEPSIDIWGLGVILYAMLTRNLPFENKRDDIVLDNICNFYWNKKFCNTEEQYIFNKIFCEKEFRINLIYLRRDVGVYFSKIEN